MNKGYVTNLVTLVCAFSMALVLVSVIFVLLVGLFDHQINNEKIFDVITPAFNTIVGGFIGLVTGIRINEKSL